MLLKGRQQNPDTKQYNIHEVQHLIKISRCAKKYKNIASPGKNQVNRNKTLNDKDDRQGLKKSQISEIKFYWVKLIVDYRKIDQ